jgi:hypothetical protein
LCLFPLSFNLDDKRATSIECFLIKLGVKVAHQRKTHAVTLSISMIYQLSLSGLCTCIHRDECVCAYMSVYVCTVFCKKRKYEKKKISHSLTKRKTENSWCKKIEGKCININNDEITSSLAFESVKLANTCLLLLPCTFFRHNVRASYFLHGYLAL